MGFSPRDRGCVSMCAPALESILYFRGMPRQRFLELKCALAWSMLREGWA